MNCYIWKQGFFFYILYYSTAVECNEQFRMIFEFKITTTLAPWYGRLVLTIGGFPIGSEDGYIN